MIHRWLRVDDMGVHTALRIVALGVLMAGCALAAPDIPALRSRLSANSLEFVRGLCFGLALAFFITAFAAIVAIRKRRNKNGRPED